MSNIIMMYGNPLSGKSTTAELLRAFFERKGEHYTIIKSVVARYDNSPVNFTADCVDETNSQTKMEKDECYKLMVDQAAQELSKGHNVILDATYHLQRRRKKVYELAKRSNANLIILNLIFSDEEQIRFYLDLRKNNQDYVDNILHTWGQYLVMVNQTEKLDKSEVKGDIIYVDRDNKDLSFYNCDENNELISEICGVIKNEVL